MSLSSLTDGGHIGLTSVMKVLRGKGLAEEKPAAMQGMKTQRTARKPRQRARKQRPRKSRGNKAVGRKAKENRLEATDDEETAGAKLAETSAPKRSRRIRWVTCKQCCPAFSIVRARDASRAAGSHPTPATDNYIENTPKDIVKENATQKGTVNIAARCFTATTGRGGAVVQPQKTKPAISPAQAALSRSRAACCSSSVAPSSVANSNSAGPSRAPKLTTETANHLGMLAETAVDENMEPQVVVPSTAAKGKEKDIPKPKSHRFTWGDPI